MGLRIREVIEMCFSGCCFEDWRGDCKHVERRDGPAPCNFEDEAEYWSAMEARDDDEGERKWEMRP